VTKAVRLTKEFNFSAKFALVLKNGGNIRISKWLSICNFGPSKEK